ncbi:MAG: hypothetical protein MUE60_15920 [Candidatus Eisenbacteria bacterium]|jgi:hypothetical protein|nr:hypothetical protein [Candidatus Eisenbacteria bacterium]
MTEAEQQHHQVLCEVVWDLYKDVNGFRPRHMDFSSMSIETLHDLIDSLDRELPAVIERDREHLEWLEEQYAQDLAAYEARQQEARELEAAYPYGEFEYLEQVA